MNLRALFCELRSVEDAQERARLIEEKCAGNLECKQRVMDLLAAAECSQASPLDRVSSALGATEGLPGVVEVGQFIVETDHHPSIGPYKLLEQIGEGGMGLVYVAQQQEPIRRTVALKLIKPGMDSRQVVARFAAERQALAMMNHPNIAKVLDAGTTESGLPYFVMELVKGVPITSFCDRQQFHLRERIELFIKVCEAVQHAHQKGIIHRDIKPSNILVELDDVRPIPKVIDFGIAKAMQQPLVDNTVYTGIAQMIGTPLYMSPEQAELHSADVDTRSDVYSLGVILYELITGSTPFDRDTLKRAGFDEMRRILREDEPPRPSARMSTLRNQRVSTLIDRSAPLVGIHLASIRSELDWIVLKALEKDRTKRYESATALAADLGRYLNDLPVEACPPDRLYRLRKAAKQHRAVLATTAIAFGALSIGLMGTAWQAYRATQARTLADARRVAEVEARLEADRQRRRAEQNLQKAREAVDRVLTRFADPRLKMLPGLEKVRAELLQESLLFYKGFLEQHSDDPELRFDTANAWKRIAQIHGEFNRTPECRSAWLEGIAVAEDLVREYPRETRYLLLAAEMFQEIGGYDAWRRSEYADAEPNLNQSIEYCRRLRAIEPTAPRYSVLYSRNQIDLAKVYRETGRKSEGDVLLRDARQVLIGMLRDGRLDARGKWVLAVAEKQLAFEIAKQQPEEAKQLFDSAISLGEEILRSDPQIYYLREELVDSYNLRGRFLLRRGQLGEAEADLKRGLELIEPLAATSFDRFVIRSFWGQTARALARVLIADGRPEEARAVALSLLNYVPEKRKAWLEIAREYELLGQADWAVEARSEAEAYASG